MFNFKQYTEWIVISKNKSVHMRLNAEEEKELLELLLCRRDDQDCPEYQVKDNRR